MAPLLLACPTGQPGGSLARASARSTRRQHKYRIPLQLAPVGPHDRSFGPSQGSICLGWWAAFSGQPPGPPQGPRGCKASMQRGSPWLPHVATASVPSAAGGNVDEPSSSAEETREVGGLDESTLVASAHAANGSSRRWSQPKWVNRLLGLRGARDIWEVPWDESKVAQVMALWFLAFWLVGSWLIPAGAHFVSVDRTMLSHRGQAFYSLVTDIAEMGVSVGILWHCLKGYWNSLRRPPWFLWSFKGVPEVLFGCLTFPLVHFLSQLNQRLCPVPDGFPSTIPLEQTLSAGDPIATVLYALVVSLCAPVWEELIFRGFLLPSLTKKHPPWLAVLLSAAAFAAAHFSPQRLLPLCFLGVVMGVIYVRTKNLAASMLLHALWNIAVFACLVR